MTAGVLRHRTTRSHYQKWEAFVQERHLAITDLSVFGLKDIAELQARYERDPSGLNTIHLSIFDNLWLAYRALQRPKIWALYEGACAYKHLLIYSVLKCEPEFTD